MDCVVCLGPLCGNAVRVDQYTCLNHLVHEECMERRGNAWRNPPNGPKRAGFACPTCGAVSMIYVPASVGGSLGNLWWAPISSDKIAGPIPEGAVLAGVESCGFEVFVARVRLRGDLVPGKWLPGCGLAYFPWGGGEYKSTECQVLCCESPNGPGTVNPCLKWVPSSWGKVVQNAVLGGWTSYGETLYIGRTMFGNDAICGKVHSSHKQVYVPYMGTEFNDSHYEILIYDSKQM